MRFNPEKLEEDYSTSGATSRTGATCSISQSDTTLITRRNRGSPRTWQTRGHHVPDPAFPPPTNQSQLSKQQTPHNTQHTTHNTQHTTHNTQHTTHNTQQTSPSCNAGPRSSRFSVIVLAATFHSAAAWRSSLISATNKQTGEKLCRCAGAPFGL
jgi:hypothetical protein